MKKSSVIWIIIILLFCSCKNQMDSSIDTIEYGYSPTFNTSYQPFVCNIHKNSVDKAVSLIRQANINQRIKDIRLIKSGDSILFYVINLDCGWVLVAADDRMENQILAYSNNGSFDENSMRNNGERYWFDMIKAVMSESVNAWNKEDDQLFKQVNRDEYVPYYWIRIPLGFETSYEEYGVNHLMDTKWGQDFPWNNLFLYSNLFENRLITGCAATATAQILYYLKQHKGFPIRLYHHIVPSFQLNFNYYDGYYYSISVERDSLTYNSNRWAEMPKDKNDNGNPDYVSSLMLDLGGWMNMKYWDQISGTDSTSITYGLSFHDVSYDKRGYDYNTVKYDINRGFPVLIYAKQQNGGGHVWVIDGYKETTTTTDYLYQWRTVSSDSLYCYSYDYCYTEEQKQIFIRDVEDGEIVHEIYGGTPVKYLRMNWGDDATTPNPNDTTYYYMPSNWNYIGQAFQYYPTIVYNLSLE